VAGWKSKVASNAKKGKMRGTGSSLSDLGFRAKLVARKHPTGQENQGSLVNFSKSIKGAVE
jgi:hypothetical protein